VGVGAGGGAVSRRLDPVPDLDAEQEVDLGRYASTILAHWWLPVLGIVLGILAGYALALGGGKVYEAEARVYLGNPFSPNGGASVPSLATNPEVVSEIVHSESALKQAAKVSGMKVGELRGHVSVARPTSTAQRVQQTALVGITVTGNRPVKTERAANALAQRAVKVVSPYVDRKIATYEETLNTLQKGIDSVTKRVTTLNQVLSHPGLSFLEKSIVVSQIDNAEQRRVGLTAQQTQTQQLLSLARNVERASVYQRAAAVKTTARSTRTSVVVGAILGLLAGIAAALVWDGVVRRRTA
jgi:uncharacterized protein involved in exopolysaccharide biosynthesis